MTYTPWTGPWEAIKIAGEEITPSLLCWRRYKVPYTGVLENFLDMNPQILEGLSKSPYLPVGVFVRMPIDTAVIAGAPTSVKQVTLFGSASR